MSSHDSDFGGVPKSGTSNNYWPALPGPPGAALLALLYQLERTQWWSPEALLNHQLKQVQNVLRHAARTVPYYRQRLGGARIGAGASSALTFDDFQRLPLLTRSDIQRAGKSLHSRQVPRDHGKVGGGVTSGSTGRPIEYRDTQLVRLYTSALTLRDHFWHKRDFTKKLAAIRQVERSESLPNWGPATDAVFSSGPCVTLDIRTPIDEQIEWLNEHQPDYLITYPSNVRALAQSCLKRGLRFANLREVRTVSEALHPDIRTLCQDAWGVPLVDQYSASEISSIALQCPDHPHYHVQSENVLVELLCDDNRPCDAGEMGRVVITTLHNFSMPLIRYDIGDYAIAGEPCPCGRGLPVIKQIVGRERNLVTLPDGRRFWPLTGYAEWTKIAPIEQFQFVQTSPTEIEAKLVMARELTKEERDRFVSTVQQSLKYPFNIEIFYEISILRKTDGKYEDFVSRVTASAASPK